MIYGKTSFSFDKISMDFLRFSLIWTDLYRIRRLKMAYLDNRYSHKEGYQSFNMDRIEEKVTFGYSHVHWFMLSFVHKFMD